MAAQSEFPGDAASEFEGELPWQSRNAPKAQGLRWTGLICLVLLLLCSNVFLAYKLVKAEACKAERTRYAGLVRNTPTSFHAHTEFQSENRSIADAAWATIDTNSAAIALSSRIVQDLGLPSSVPFPWDEDRQIYFVKGYHQLHCIKYLRTAFVVLEREQDREVRFGHVYHCLDMLRQIVMCEADDRPQAFSRTGEKFSLGDGEQMQCRDWNKMTAWAQQPGFDACYNEISDFDKVAHSLELYGFCRLESPYRPVMESYFEIHGHKPMFNDPTG